MVKKTAEAPSLSISIFKADISSEENPKFWRVSKKERLILSR